MAAPARVPVDPIGPKHYSSPPRRESSWTADRPGETIGSAHPMGGALGNQGPDQGYALKLAKRFEDRLVLRSGEHAEDAITGAVAVAMRRAGLYGRGPIAADVEIGLLVFGFLEEAPDDLVTLRRDLFDEVHHTTVHYFAARRIADAVPEETIRMSPSDAASLHATDWRKPLGV